METVSHADLKSALHSVADRAGEVLAGTATAAAEDCALFEECDVLATVGAMFEALTRIGIQLDNRS